MRKTIRRTWRGRRWLKRILGLVRDQRTEDRRSHYAETGSFQGTTYDCGLCLFSSPDKNERDEHERSTHGIHHELERVRESDYDARAGTR